MSHFWRRTVGTLALRTARWVTPIATFEAIAAAPVAVTGSSESTEVRPRVLVEVAKDTQGDLPLLRAELEALGLEVVEESASDIGEARQGPWHQDPRTVCRIVVKTKSVEVWVFDPESNTIALHEVYAQADGSPLAARTAVLHAVELLGWSLRERKGRAAQTRAPLPARTSPAIMASPAPNKEWLMTLTPLLLHSPGGTSPGAGAAMDLTWQKRQFGVRLLGAGLLWPNELTQPEGRVEVTSRWLGLQGVVFAKSPWPRMSFSLGAGMNLLSVYLRGTTDLDFQVHEDGILTVAPGLDVRSFYALGDAISVGLGASGMVPLRSDIIRIEDREVARYGRLMLTLGIGLQAALR